MTFRSGVWLLAAALTVHNAEELIFFPEWTRPALAVVTVAMWVVAALAAGAPPRSKRAYAAVAAAGILGLNVLFPHLLATIVLREYAPGVVTAVLVNSWVAALVVRAALREGIATPRGSVKATGVAIAVVVICLPGLFWIGAMLGS